MNRRRFVGIALMLIGISIPAIAQGGGASVPGPARLKIVLASGREFPVFQLKYWTFQSGEPPALQLEYQTALPITDTAALGKEVREIWPAFARYLEGMGLTGAIITASEPADMNQVGPFSTSHRKRFGFIFSRSPDGRWQGKPVPESMPAAETSGPLRIYDAKGDVMPIPSLPPK